jgi:N-acetylglucosaminyldiphosphoundecaprenol N-acetyl-beta-D-mannosaminyltransferase
MSKYLDRVSLLGVDIDNLTMAETLTRIEQMISSGTFSYVVTPNVDHLMKVQKDSVFREIYKGANLAVPDGAPLLWASKILGTPLKERVNGTDLFLETCALAATKGYSIFLLGGDPGFAEKAGVMLKEKYPGLKVAGHYGPEFGWEKDLSESVRVQKLITASNADILFVAMGAPRQEIWMGQFGPGCNVRVAFGIGGSFSILIGAIKRAPLWMRRSGLEWFWRMLFEPRRLYKRYLIDDMPFILLIARAWLKQRVI